MTTLINGQAPTQLQLQSFRTAFGLMSAQEVADAMAALESLTPEQTAALTALIAGTAAAVDSVARSSANSALTLAQQALTPADAEPITESLPSIMNTDLFIVYRGGVPFTATAAAVAAFFGTAPAATEPAALTVLMWDAQPTAVPGEMAIDISTLPADGGSPLTGFEYRIGTGAATALTGTGTGIRTVTAGFSAGTQAAIQVRAVNAVNPGPWSDTKNRTPLAASGGSVDYLAETYTPVTAGLTTITRPAGAGAGHSLVAIVFSDSTATPTTQAAPSGWTAGTGLTLDTVKGSRVYTAPGDVATLEFDTTGADGILCFAVSGALRAGYSYTGSFWENNAGADAPTGAVDASEGDCIVSAYIQIDNGAAGGVGVFAGPIQSGYTQRLQQYTEATPPFISVISRAGVSAGSTGAISHGVNANFSTRFLFTGAFA